MFKPFRIIKGRLNRNVFGKGPKQDTGWQVPPAMPPVGFHLLLADGVSKLLQADGVSKILISGQMAPSGRLLLADGASNMLLADGVSKLKIAGN